MISDFKLKAFTLLWVLLSAASLWSQNYDIPNSRSFTSRNQLIDPDLKVRQSLIQSDSLNMSFTHLDCSNSQVISSEIFCQNEGSIQFLASDRSISFHPMLELEHRNFESIEDEVSSTNVGGILKGHINDLSFWVDTRIYSESHSNFENLGNRDLSWDREFVEKQVEDANGTSANLTFVSYARYRAAMTYDSEIGRFGARRENLHWGPGRYLNLTFSQSSVPFNHLYYQGSIGPVRVMTVWGQLSRASEGEFQRGEDFKSIYAHRYEWLVSKYLTLGLSEQLILYNHEEPFAFAPVVPLFMHKGQGVEEDNNGNISFDFQLRLPKYALIYSEFMIDDLQEPSTLFDDFWGNRWAWMYGFHLSHPQAKGFGLIYEYSRVEPWVYTHYVKGTAQSTNGSAALGNYLGPNSQAYILNPYYSRPLTQELDLQFGLKNEWVWKGQDAGSSIDDGTDERYAAEQAGFVDKDKKRFLDNASMDYILSPQLLLRGYGLQLDLEAKLWTKQADEFIFRIAYQY